MYVPLCNVPLGCFLLELQLHQSTCTAMAAADTLPAPVKEVFCTQSATRRRKRDLPLQELLDATHTILADLDRREHREPAKPPRHDMRRVKSGAAAATQEKLPLQAPSEGAAAAADKGNSKKEKESKVEAKAEQKQGSPPSDSQVGPSLQVSCKGSASGSQFPTLGPWCMSTVQAMLNFLLDWSKGSASVCWVDLQTM